VSPKIPRDSDPGFLVPRDFDPEIVTHLMQLDQYVLYLAQNLELRGKALRGARRRQRALPGPKGSPPETLESPASGPPAVSPPLARPGNAPDVAGLRSAAEGTVRPHTEHEAARSAR